MKISSITCTPLAATPPRPVQFSIGTFSTFYAGLVEVRTDDGLIGVGECIVRRAPEVVTTIVDRLLAPQLIGRDPWDVEGLWDEMLTLLRRWGHSRGFVVEAMSGIDIALWDLLARSVGKPLYKFLGGAGRDRVRCYVSKVYFDEIPRMADEARALVAQGHTAIKVQVGWPASRAGHHADVETVRAIREAVGTRVEIMLDANGAYDVGTAVRVGRQLEELNVAWLEEPVPADDLASLHLAAAAPNFYTYEYMGTSYIQNPLRDIFTAPFPAPKEGLIALPQGPGLGLEIDPGMVRRYAAR